MSRCYSAASPVCLSASARVVASERRPAASARPRGDRPHSRAAEQRDELASLHLTELHWQPLRHGVSDSITDWRGSSQGLAAVRDFGPANDRSGSIASGTSGDTPWPASGPPPKPDQNSERLRFARAALHRPQSSSASRFTAAQVGFFILSQSGERRSLVG
jgi:hypothetical protein